MLVFGLTFCLIALMIPTKSDGIDMVEGWKTKINRDRNHSVTAEAEYDGNGGNMSVGFTTSTKISYFCKQKNRKSCPSIFLVPE